MAANHNIMRKHGMRDIHAVFLLVKEITVGFLSIKSLLPVRCLLSCICSEIFIARAQPCNVENVVFFNACFGIIFCLLFYVKSKCILPLFAIHKEKKNETTHPFLSLVKMWSQSIKSEEKHDLFDKSLNLVAVKNSYTL